MTNCQAKCDTPSMKAIIIDQDNQASFINAHYKTLRPKVGPNTLKYTVTQTIVDYAVNQTNCNLVLCNSNLDRNGRMDTLNYFRRNGIKAFLSISIFRKSYLKSG